MRALACAPREAQERVLRRIVRKARDTQFAREHGLGAVRTLADLARAVPLRDYAASQAWWTRARAGEPDVCWPGRIRYWAITSGTTAGEKLMPVSADTIRTNRLGGFDALVPFLAQDPRDLFAGRLVFLGGCTALREEGPIVVGDNTGIMARHVPRLLARRHAPSAAVRAIPGWEAKIARAADELVDADVRMISGVPSWLVLFGEAVLERARARGADAADLRSVWPKLALFVHGGVVFEPYARRVRALFGETLTCIDTYSASEGGMLAVQDLPGDRGMLPLCDRGVVFEFVPLGELEELGKPGELGTASPRRVPLADVETGVDYAVVVTTDSGIFGYLLGDVVRFVSRAPLRLVFAGRVAHQLNAYGEHLSGAEIERAMAEVAQRSGATVVEFASTAAFPVAGDPLGGHLHFVEFEGTPPEPRAFARALDAAIAAGNEDYATHRSHGVREPVVLPVPRGTFYAWMRLRGKLGGQNKVPRVLNDELRGSLEAFLARGERDGRDRPRAQDARSIDA
ncbi:MAG: GH3 auxin-responsive promoter family protein [Planctomycetes bacterium]|nr:GH3 auxin-responsive promoter family protein [Planctomycetota bacterium]